MDLIRLPDGRTTVVADGQHFMELIREFMGTDAADWYRNRMERVMENVRFIREHGPDLTDLPPLRYLAEARRWEAVQKWAADLSPDDRDEVLYAAVSIPDWDD